MSPRFATHAILALLTSLLVGCHAAKVLIPPNLRPPSKDDGMALKMAESRLHDATPCCRSYADFSFQTQLPWQPRKYTLGSTSMVANLDGTNSYFLAFRLPSHVKLPYRIALKATLSGRWLHSSYLFAPTIVTLDDGFQPLGSEDITLCEHMGWSDTTSGALGQYTVSSDKARYLLVYSSAKQQASKTYWEQSPASFSTKATLDMGATGSFSVPHGPDGALWIGMMDTAFAKAIDTAICKKPPKGDGVLNTLRTSLPLPWINDGKPKPAPAGNLDHPGSQ